jgi:hypothetical protein
MVSFVGIPGSLLGNGISTHVLAAVASVVACAAAWRLGALARTDSSRLTIALAGATVLSLVAAPHAYAQDLVMVAPALVWVAAWASNYRSAAARSTRTRLAAVFAAWALLSAVAVIDFLDGAVVPPGQLTAWVLVIAGSAVCAAALRRDRTPGEVTATPALRSDVLRTSPIR